MESEGDEVGGAPEVESEGDEVGEVDSEAGAAQPSEPWWQNDPTILEMKRRAFEEIQGWMDGSAPPKIDEPDPFVDELYNETRKRALVTARDNLAKARTDYDSAVMQARSIGYSWAEIGAVLGVSKQHLHRRFRHR